MDKTQRFIINYMKTHEIPNSIICDALCWGENLWRAYKNGTMQRELTVYEQIMFMSIVHVSLPE